MHSGFPACFAFLCSSPMKHKQPPRQELLKGKFTNQSHQQSQGESESSSSEDQLPAQRRSDRNARKRAAGEGEEQRQEPGRSRGHGLGHLEEALEAPRAAELEAVPLFQCNSVQIPLALPLPCCPHGCPRPFPRRRRGLGTQGMNFQPQIALCFPGVNDGHRCSQWPRTPGPCRRAPAGQGERQGAKVPAGNGTTLTARALWCAASCPQGPQTALRQTTAQ